MAKTNNNHTNTEENKINNTIYTEIDTNILNIEMNALKLHEGSNICNTNNINNASEFIDTVAINNQVNTSMQNRKNKWTRSLIEVLYTPQISANKDLKYNENEIIKIINDITSEIMLEYNTEYQPRSNKSKKHTEHKKVSMQHDNESDYDSDCSDSSYSSVHSLSRNTEKDIRIMFEDSTKKIVSQFLQSDNTNNSIDHTSNV